MSLKREFIDYVQDIYNAVKSIEMFTKGMEYNQFASDLKTVFAVTRAFEIIGEATKKIPTTIKSRYPDIPWRATCIR